MNSIRIFITFLIIESIVSISCKKETSCEGCASKNNKPPIAVAGPDQVITLPTDSILLDGSSSSDPDGMISDWLWTKISGPVSFTIVKASDSITKIKALVVGNYSFELKITDNGGLSAKDTIRIIVDPVLTTNHPPIANAGADTTISLPANTFNLDGSQSIDLENNITGYAWTKISGPASFHIVNGYSAQTQATNLIEGIYLFELKVTDAGGLFSQDTIQLIVNPVSGANLPPIANAGPDISVTYDLQTCSTNPSTITLNGSNSYDPDGSIVSYLWTGPGNIAPRTSATANVNGITSDINIFVLKVTDNNGAFTYDTVQIVILNVNRPLIPAQLTPIGTLSQPRFDIAVATAGNKIVFAGGHDGNEPLSTVDIYDIVTSTWSTAQLRTPRFEIAATTCGNKIFFAGGYFQNGSWAYLCKDVDIYDASTNTWSVDTLSIPRSGLAAASVGNKVFFAGGTTDNWEIDYLNTVDIYDLTASTWSTSTLSEARGYLSAVTAGNKIYFAGGEKGIYSPSNRIDIYDNATSSWSVSTLIEPKKSMASIFSGGKIYWAGGLNFTNNYYYSSGQVEIKNITAQTSSQACLSHPSNWYFQPNGAVEKNNKIVFFNANYSYSGGGVNNKFDIYDVLTNTWSTGVLNQDINKSAAIISVNNTIYVAGGYVNGIVSNQVWKLEF